MSMTYSICSETKPLELTPKTELKAGIDYPVLLVGGLAVSALPDDF